MRFTRTLAAAAAAWMALACACTGCRSTGTSSADGMPPTAADAATVQGIRDRYTRAYPESRVGVVIATLPSERLVAVGELPDPAKLRTTEVVTFIDGRGRVLTTGTIVRVLPDSVHVRYARPPRGGRAPARGDVALLRLPPGAAAL